MQSATLAPVVAQPPQVVIAVPGHIGCGRFSTGIEQQPHTALRIGRFSDGIEQHSDTPDKRRVGRFSDGIERVPNGAVTLRVGSFADGYGHGA